MKNIKKDLYNPYLVSIAIGPRVIWKELYELFLNKTFKELKGE